MRRFFIIAFFTVRVFAYSHTYNPPIGGEDIFTNFSTNMLSGGFSATGGAAWFITPASTLANPALAAAEQRIVIDIAYTAIPVFGDDFAYGQSCTAGTIIPFDWGVITAGYGGVYSHVDPLPLGNLSTFFAGFSKEIERDFFVGFNLWGGFGASWALNAGLGILHMIPLGDAVPDFRYGVSAVNLGKTFSSEGEGIIEDGDRDFPSVFTLRAGVAGTVVNAEMFKLGLSLDVTFPCFLNAIIDFGLGMEIAKIVVLRANVPVNVRELIEQPKSGTAFPAVSLGFKFAIDTGKSEFMAQNDWKQSEIVINAGFKPALKGLQKIAGEGTLYLGMPDKEGPTIRIGEE